MQVGSPSPGPVVFRNNAAVFLWGFMGAWMLMLALFTCLYVRDGDNGEKMLPLVLMAFWLFGWAACHWAFGHARVRVEIGHGRVLAREVYAWSTRENRYAASDVFVPDVVEEKDSDGDPYFKCLLRLPDGRSLTVAESHSRPRMEARRAELLAALAVR